MPGCKLPVAVERRQQRVDRAFVHAERKLAALEASQFLHAFADFFAQIQHAVGIFEQQRAGIGEHPRARAANEQRLPDPLFELADRDADGGLRAVELFGRAGKALLARDGLKHLQRRQIHSRLLPGPAFSI